MYVFVPRQILTIAYADFLQVKAIVNNGPCDGILEPGDTILGFGNTQVEGKSLSHFVALLSKNPSAEIELSIRRGTP